jgi:hypothetical protein
MTSSTVSALPQQSEAARILNSTRRDKAGVHPSIVLFGRFLFSLIFIMSAAGHFSKETIAYAAAQGVPLASITAPISGIMPARRIKHSVGVSIEDRRVDNCAISDSGVARHAQILGSGGPDDGENADGSFHEKRVHTR